MYFKTVFFFLCGAVCFCAESKSFCLVPAVNLIYRIQFFLLLNLMFELFPQGVTCFVSSTAAPTPVILSSVWFWMMMKLVMQTLGDQNTDNFLWKICFWVYNVRWVCKKDLCEWKTDESVSKTKGNGIYNLFFFKMIQHFKTIVTIKLLHRPDVICSRDQGEELQQQFFPTCDQNQVN